jgi:uncharacterized protein YdeI (YjbR/CyaY-like superfamily)
VAKLQPKVHYFPDAASLRAWLAQHAATADELVVGYYKRHTGKPSPTWSESVDEALCYGWIDGIRRSVDADRFTNRFTPRRRGSHWSNVNIAKVQGLIAARKLTPAGLAAFQARTARKTGRASYEQRPHAFPPEHLRVFAANASAWAWFSTQPPGYRRTAIWFVVSAVKAETQAKRLAFLIEASAEQRRIIGPTAGVAKAPVATKTKTKAKTKTTRRAKPKA